MMGHPDAATDLAIFSRDGHSYCAACLEPEDDRYRMRFDQVCRLLVQGSRFKRLMPPEVGRTATLYLASDASTVTHMRDAQMRHVMRMKFDLDADEAPNRAPN
jgi:hypothetical protein